MKYQFGFFPLEFVLKLNSVVAQIIIWKSFFGRLFFSSTAICFECFILSIVLSCLFFVYFFYVCFSFEVRACVCVAILLAISIWLLNICCIWQRTRFIYILCHSFGYISFRLGYACAGRFAWLTSTRLIHEIVLFLFRFWIFVCVRVSKVYRPLFVRKVFGMWCEEQSERPITTLKIRKRIVERDTFETNSGINE